MSRFTRRGTDLVLLAHGSPDPRHGRDVATLVAATAAQVGPDVAVSAAYLDHQGPTPAECAQGLVASGASAALVVPLFIARGYHVRVDVPQAADVMSACGLDLTLASPGLAGSPQLVELALAAQVATRRPAVLFAAGSTDATACQRLRAQVREVSRRHGLPLATAFLTGGPDLPAALAELAGSAENARPLHEPQVVPFVIADGVLRDQMQVAASRSDMTLVPGSLATNDGLARLVADGYRDSLAPHERSA